MGYIKVYSAGKMIWPWSGEITACSLILSLNINLGTSEIWRDIWQAYRVLNDLQSYSMSVIDVHVTVQHVCECHMSLCHFRCDFDDTAQYRVSAMNSKGELSAFASVVVKRMSKMIPSVN